MKNYPKRKPFGSSRKIISKEKTEIDQDNSEEVNVDPQTSTTDFDDLASQLA